MITGVEGLIGDVDKLIVHARISIKHRMDESLINSRCINVYRCIPRSISS